MNDGLKTSAPCLERTTLFLVVDLGPSPDGAVNLDLVGLCGVERLRLRVVFERSRLSVQIHQESLVEERCHLLVPRITSPLLIPQVGEAMLLRRQSDIGRTSGS